jgi:glycosyltransferase involved in cell wall biosynthesis
MTNARRLIDIWRSQGLAGFKDRISDRFHQRHEQQRYEKWIKACALSDKQLRELHDRAETFAHRPLISVILPVYDPPETWLRRCIDSVVEQVYSNWELCIADDCSTLGYIRPLLEQYAADDARVKVVFRTENGHISTASNSALELATGEFVALLDHDDELSPDALFWVAREINETPDAAMIYSDEDMIDSSGRRYNPKFKPDWSRDLFYSVNYVTHLATYRTDLVRSIGGFRCGFEGSQDYDLALRYIEHIAEERIRHIPRILYHWRAIEGSVAHSADAKPYAHERARKAIGGHLERSGVNATVEATELNLHRVRYKANGRGPSVSLFLLGSTPIDSADIAVQYGQVETVIVDSDQNLARALNRAIEDSSGEVLCFVNAYAAPVSNQWLHELVGFVQQAGIGVVGGRIIDRRRHVIDGALIVGTTGLASIANERVPSTVQDSLFRNNVIGNFSAVSISCMAIRKDIFDEVGGFDEQNLRDTLFDVDLCLRIREKGYRVVFTPFVELVQTKPCSRKQPSKREAEYFRGRWAKFFENDPFYNPNLTKKDGSFSIDI